jgi:hypothetical protein
METTLNDTRTLKDTIEDASQKSKEAIKSIIDSSSKQINLAIDANRTFVDALQEQLRSKELDASVIDPVKKTFGRSIELAEEVIDSVIDAHTRRMDQAANFNLRLVDIIKEEGELNTDTGKRLMELIHENFENSVEISNENMKTIIDIYNKHINLALNFNKKFSEGINAQMQGLFTIQSKNIDIFNSWVSEWWKQSNHA